MTLLVIDLGSSSARALLFDDEARLIAGSIRSRRYDFHTDTAGRASAGPAQIRAHIETCLDEVLQHPAARKIRAVGMASFAGNWLGLDETGEACTPVFTYADTLSRDEIPQLLRKLGGDADSYHQAVGCMLHTAYLPAQFAHLLRSNPATEARIKRVSDIGGYLYSCWFGREIPTSYSIASWSGLLHTRELAWHGEYAHLLAGPTLLEKLPALADFDAVQRGLSDSYARRWPALRDTPFFLALGDGAVANIGSGAVDARHIALTIGTTSALRVVRKIPRLPAGLWRYLVCAGMPLVGGATSEGGNVYQWAVQELDIDEVGLEARLRERAPDAHGLTVLPLLAGERSPGWQPKATGTIHGIRRGTSRIDILQAHLEAVAIRLSLILDLFETENSVVMAGGGALVASRVWAQMIADAFDRPIHLLAEAEITARGVALLLRRSLDQAPLDADPPPISAVVQPDAAGVKALRAARDRQIDLYRRLYS